MVKLEPLNVDNWLTVCRLSVTEEQQQIFPVPNVYWVGISRYEEHTTLYAVKADDIYVGMIGLGYDEDGVSGYLNPLMIDKNYQGKGYAKQALTLAIQILKEELNVSVVHLGHRKNNVAAAALYEKLGFEIIEEHEKDYYRELKLDK